MPARSYVAVIDDDEGVCRAMGRLLHNAGMSPITYRSAEEFLDDRMRVPYSCLVVDIQLEGMSGLELNRRLTACRVNTPIIYITAVDDPQLREEAMKAGGAAFFRKTDAGSEVLKAIRSAIGVSSPA